MESSPIFKMTIENVQTKEESSFLTEHSWFMVSGKHVTTMCYVHNMEDNSVAKKVNVWNKNQNTDVVENVLT